MMKLNYFNVAALALAFAAAAAEAQSFRFMGAGESETRTTLVIRSDGSCALTNEAVQPRRSLEMQVASWERYSKMSEGTDSDEQDATAPPPPKPARKTFTNEELAAKLREMYEQRPGFGGEDDTRVDRVDVSTNSVRLATGRSFASLKELLSQSPYTWGPTILMYDDARFEIDTNRNLRITFSTAQNASRYAKTFSREWKSSKTKFEWKLVLPGKILGSGLPGVQDNATSVSLDGEKPESVDAAIKLMGAPLVITAEAAGITLDEPLESKKLARASGGQRRAGPDLPITDAGPGYHAEPLSIALSSVHHFPEGEKYFKDRPMASMFGMETPGTVVSAKLFPPKGREIRSVSGVRVKAAKDDKGRAITDAGEGGGGEESFSEFTSFDSGDSERTGAARLEIRLALPAPDAKAIDELECEAVALTIGGWKELTLTNVQADAKKEIDIGEVLAGAKLVIRKIGGRMPQRTIEATLEGPAGVAQIELKTEVNSRQGGHSSTSERRSTTAGAKTIRNVTVQSYEFSMSEEDKRSPLTLLVRFPQDTRRERVRFKLTALDLL
jgi:hypothetical protein